MLILSKVLVMPCFEITSVWRGYHILIYYVIQCAHAYINPGVYKTHKVFLFIKCTWKILGLRILSDTAFTIHISSFENIIMSNINGWDTLKMECYERIIFFHIVTRFCWIKWNTICVDILNICMLSYNIIFTQRIVTPPPPPPPPREMCIQIGICFHFR